MKLSPTFTRPLQLRLVDRRDAVLHQAAAPVDTVDSGVKGALDDMAALMKRSGGCGLAGPQVGIPHRLIIVQGPDGVQEVANPTIVSQSGGTPSLEGCLSLPGSMSLVWRSSRVTVEGLDEHGQKFSKQCKGLEARCFQHEIDHLDGKLITDSALFTVTPLRALGVAAGGTIGAFWHGAAGACVGGTVGAALAWATERIRK